MQRLLYLAAAAALSGCMTGPAPMAAGETVIPFASNGGIIDWHAVDNQSLFVQDRGSRWYFVRLGAHCPALRFNQTVVFDTGASGQFDRFSSVVTRDARCPVESIVPSGRPRAKGGKA